MTPLEKVLGKFPNLNQTRLAITSPETPKYNCIAFAAGEMHRWWWPDALGVGYWPRQSPRAVVIAAFQVAFESIGYSLSSSSDYESGIEKVAFFHKNGTPTHAARQLHNGIWTSKLGNSFDISHDLEGMVGDVYGKIALIMQRTI